MGKEDLTHHELLKQDQVRQSGQILEPLAHELSQPRNRLRTPKKPIRDIQGVLRLTAGSGQVQRPRGARQRTARLDQLGDGDVDDSLAAGLAAGDADDAADLPRHALTCGAGELVPEKCIYRIDASLVTHCPFRTTGLVISASLTRFASRVTGLSLALRPWLRNAPQSRPWQSPHVQSLRALGHRGRPGFTSWLGGVPRAVRCEPADRSAGGPSS